MRVYKDSPQYLLSMVLANVPLHMRCTHENISDNRHKRQQSISTVLNLAITPKCWHHVRSGCQSAGV